ncbi:MAG: two-component sensor histidine kinase [Deltaproteobacteria bacterium]|nr:two-component sensor histidine kinase [Deltaproteobacteria bacterium]
MSQQEKTKKDYLGMFIRSRFLSVLLTSITPLILVSVIILFQFYTSYHEKVRAHLETLVNKHKLNIDTFLHERLGNIRFLAENHSIGELSNQALLDRQLTLLQEEYNSVFVDLGVINENGIQVAYAGPFKLRKADYSEADWLKRALESQYFISDVFLGLRGLPHFIISVKVKWNGQPWILRATIDFMAFNDLVENIRIGETGFAFIVNRSGEFQTKPLYNIEPKETPYIDFLKNKGINDIQVVTKSNSFLRKNLYVSTSLKQGDWLLIFQQNASDAFSDFYEALQITLVIILLGSVATFMMAFIRFKNMTINVEKAEKEKQLMNEQIIQTGKLASVGELAAGIAHEINNPVAIMVEEAGWMEDLLEEEERSQIKNLDEFVRALKQIRTQGHRCKEITQKLLSFARKTDSRIQDVQINDVMEEVVAISSQRAKYSNVTLNMDLHDIPTVKISQTEMQQVFLNLINNALDAMEKKGGVLDISSQVEDGHIVLTFADNGPGIPRANLGRIFDPFFTTKPVGKGTGLGLAICYGIIKTLGGEISVQSTVDVGTTFYVKIPIDVNEK